MTHLKLLFLLMLVVLPGCAGPYTIAVVVRHAEKQSVGSDPALTTAGQQRAEALRDRLTGLVISGVYTTDTQRTRQTAAPIALSLGLSAVVYSTPAQIAATVMKDHRGEAVLIVGHSNTVAEIVTAFGADLPTELPQPINEDDFDNMVTIVVNGRGLASAVHSTYGVPSP